METPETIMASFHAKLGCGHRILPNTARQSTTTDGAVWWVLHYSPSLWLGGFLCWDELRALINERIMAWLTSPLCQNIPVFLWWGERILVSLGGTDLETVVTFPRSENVAADAVCLLQEVWSSGVWASVLSHLHWSTKEFWLRARFLPPCPATAVGLGRITDDSKRPVNADQLAT